MKKISFKKALPYLAVLFVFLVTVVIYFSPVLEGKRLNQSDISQWKGMSKEITDYRQKTGEEALWTNSMFGGMPAYQISVQYKGNLIRYIDDIFKLGLPHPANLVFIYLLGFFILLMVLRVNPWLALAGSVAFAFSSYFFIILEAGHNSKAHAIGYMAPVLAGILLTYRGKHIAGALLTALFLALELRANHLQITYYLMLVVVLLGITRLVVAIQEKTVPEFLKATGLLVAAALLALSTNVTNLWATWEYGKETIRGKSELSHSPENRTTGLDKDYATQWSYGKGETFSLMVPNVKGGATGMLGNNEKAMQQVDPTYANMIARQNQYWGDQPFTSGPVYVGAAMVFLFILGMFVLKGWIRWWLFSATVMAILLSWGKNFMPLTDFFLHYIPGYNKFRAVSTILVIAELTIPLLAILTLKEIFEKPGLLKKHMRAFYLSLGITAGLAALFYLIPQVFFDFFSQMEQSALNEQRQSLDAAQLTQFNDFVENFKMARVSILKADALRSLFFILSIGAVLFLYSREKLSKSLFIVLVIVITALDLIPVAHRYLNNEDFARKQMVNNPFPATAADKIILKDVDPNFRVFNSMVSTFQDASTSYYHKSIGGYHGAKLRRYQELIENQMMNGNEAVFNMLNTKYFIVSNEQGQPVVQINMEALGNAWFVSDFRIVKNADEEMNALSQFSPERTAIIDQRYKPILGNFSAKRDTTANIELTEYAPNQLVYHSKSTLPQMAVFSEIYYDKGWDAYIDEKPAPYFRANYVLRAMIIPEGEHTITFKFEPSVYFIGEKISFAGSLLLLLLGVGYLVTLVRRGNNKQEAGS